VSSLTQDQASTKGTPLRIGNFIGGEWGDALSEKTHERRNSANYEEVVGYYPASDRADARRAIGAAQEAFPGWRKTLVPQRARILEKACHIMDKNVEEFARDVTTLEQGKALKNSHERTAFLTLRLYS
jgi:acyl-CoA reductase-like NAD-dependent aldehyde dehydrogenase